MSLSPATIDGVRFKVKRYRRYEWLVAVIGDRTFLINESSSEFFKGWAFSIDERESGRPITSSVGKTYYPTKEEAFAAALAA